MSFQRVGAAAGRRRRTFDFKVSLVSPGHMETYCPGVGTGGYTSCRYGDRAVINLARWATAVPDYKGDIATYRLYVINHEVGHVLGHGHEQCPGPGQVAPVMQQQTLGPPGLRQERVAVPVGARPLVGDHRDGGNPRPCHAVVRVNDGPSGPQSDDTEEQPCPCHPWWSPPPTSRSTRSAATAAT